MFCRQNYIKHAENIMHVKNKSCYYRARCFSRAKCKTETISSTQWGFVEWQPCARNDRLALGRPHMGLISPHFSFILSWQNNGCLWRVSYPPLSLFLRPKCLRLRRAILSGPVHGDSAVAGVGAASEMSRIHIGLWLNSTSVVSHASPPGLSAFRPLP